MLCRSCGQKLLPTCRSLTYTHTRALSTSAAFRLPDSPPPATSTSAAQPFSTPLSPSPKKTPGFPPTSKSSKPSSSTPAPPLSSVPAGTPLRGLNFLKSSATDPVLAKPDEEYPSWLWTLLSDSNADTSTSPDGTTTSSLGGGKNKDAGAGDAFAKSAKQRKLAAKAARARMASGVSEEDEEMRRVVRIDEASVDLGPHRQAMNNGGGEGNESAEAGKGSGESPLAGMREEARAIREEARLERLKQNQGMRERRRKEIKEGNFLRGMR